ncbi:MAG: MFS transporter [Mediterraneibacter sp.]
MKQKVNTQNMILLAIVALFWFAQYVYIPYQTTYLTAAGAAGNVVGIVVGAYGISQLVLRLPAGVCADRLGRHKPFIMTGAAAAGAASLFRVFLCDERGFMAGNLLSGLASAMWISFMVFYTGKFGKEDQQRATSRIVLFNNLGMLLGFIASTLCYSRIGMRNLCLFSVAAGAAAFCLALLLKEEKRNVSQSGATVPQLLQVCRGRRILVFSLIALIQQGIQLTTAMSFTSQILKDCGASDSLVGISSIIYMVSAVCFSAMASSKLCEKHGPKFWIPAVLAVLAVYCILVPASGSIPVILALQVLPGMATGILFSYATSEAMKGVPEEKRSTAMGFFQAVYAIGMTAFPMFTGSIVSAGGMEAGYLVLAGIAAAGIIIAKVYYHREKGRDR